MKELEKMNEFQYSAAILTNPNATDKEVASAMLTVAGMSVTHPMHEKVAGLFETVLKARAANGTLRTVDTFMETAKQLLGEAKKEV